MTNIRLDFFLFMVKKIYIIARVEVILLKKITNNPFNLKGNVKKIPEKVFELFKKIPQSSGMTA